MITSLFLVSNVYAQNNNGNNMGESDNIAKTSYFSIEPLDNWTYEINSDKTTAQTMGSGASNAIILYPKDIDIGTAVEAGNAVIANFEKDNTYNVKNAPLNDYVKYHTENAIAPITSQENIIIDGEPAIKVLANVKGDQGEMKYLFIYTIHDSEYYNIGLMGNTNNFNRYLPEFEQMLSTFKFGGLGKDSTYTPNPADIAMDKLFGKENETPTEEQYENRVGICELLKEEDKVESYIDCDKWVLAPGKYNEIKLRALLEILKNKNN
jgi:hypothetical protein